MTPKRLRDLRELTNLSQVELAKRAGIDRSRLSMYENAHVDLTEEQKTALRDALQKAMQERSAQHKEALEKFALQVVTPTEQQNPQAIPTPVPAVEAQ